MDEEEDRKRWEGACENLLEEEEALMEMGKGRLLGWRMLPFWEGREEKEEMGV